MAKPIAFSKRESIWNKTGGKCAYCGIQLSPFNGQIDHIIPKAKDGKNDLENIFYSCKTCNATKGSKDLEVFRHRLAFKTSTKYTFTDEQATWILSEYGIDLKPEKFLFFYERGGK